jgi:hypothetical protein
VLVWCGLEWLGGGFGCVFLTFILVCVGKGVKIEFCPAKSKKKCENLHVLPPFLLSWCEGRLLCT